MSCAASPIPTRTPSDAFTALSCCCSISPASARSRRQLQAARDEAIEANRSKSRFLAAASHDLRQPLHAMTLFVSALSRRLREGETGRTGRQCRPVPALAALDDRHAARHVQDRGGPDQAEPRADRARRTVRALRPASARRRATGGSNSASRRPRPRSWPTARCWSSRCAICSPTRSNSRERAACCSACGAARRIRRHRRRHRRRRRARPRRARVRGIPSRQDGRDRAQRGHWPRPRHRQAPDGADGRRLTLRSRPGKGSVFTLWLREAGGRRRARATLRARRRHRSRAGASSSSTTIRSARRR